jgi:hypothetical protein
MVAHHQMCTTRTIFQSLDDWYQTLTVQPPSQPCQHSRLDSHLQQATITYACRYQTYWTMDKWDHPSNSVRAIVIVIIDDIKCRGSQCPGREVHCGRPSLSLRIRTIARNSPCLETKGGPDDLVVAAEANVVIPIRPETCRTCCFLGAILAR